MNIRCGFLIGMSGFALTGLAPYALADAVLLSNDVRLEGVLIDNPDGELELKVSADGTIFLDTHTVVGVERSSRARNEELLKSWAEDGRRAEREQRERETFAAAQQVRGLVLYEGEWLKSEEADRLIRLKRLFPEEEETERRPAATVVNVYVKPPVTRQTFIGVGIWRGPASRQGAGQVPDRFRGAAAPLLPPVGNTFINTGIGNGFQNPGIGYSYQRSPYDRQGR